MSEDESTTLETANLDDSHHRRWDRGRLKKLLEVVGEVVLAIGRSPSNGI